MCIQVTVCDHSVETGTLGTLMGALVMLNVLDFDNCGQIVILVTCGQIDGANHCYSSESTDSDWY